MKNDTPTRPAAAPDLAPLDLVTLAAPRLPTIDYGGEIPMPNYPIFDDFEDAIAKSWGPPRAEDAVARPARVTWYAPASVEWFKSLSEAEASIDRLCRIDDEGLIFWLADPERKALGQVEES